MVRVRMYLAAKFLQGLNDQFKGLFLKRDRLDVLAAFFVGLTGNAIGFAVTWRDFPARQIRWRLVTGFF